MQRIRLLLLDDHVLFRESLSRFLGSEPDLEMAAHCGTLAEAQAVLETSPVDLVLLDFDLEHDLGTRFLARARKSGYGGKVLMVTAGMSALEVSSAMEQGASGIFLKHSSPATLVEAIRRVMGGETWIDPKVSQVAGQRPSRAEKAPSRVLTHREQQVLRAVFEGFANKEIAARLGVSESAVKATLQQLFEKTGVRTRSQLVRIALEWSLEKPGAAT